MIEVFWERRYLTVGFMVSFAPMARAFALSVECLDNFAKLNASSVVVSPFPTTQLLILSILSANNLAYSSFISSDKKLCPTTSNKAFCFFTNFA